MLILDDLNNTMSKRVLNKNFCVLPWTGFELEPNAFTKTIDGGSNNYTASVKLSPDTGSHNSLLFRMRALRDNGNTTLYELVNTIKS